MQRGATYRRTRGSPVARKGVGERGYRWLFCRKEGRERARGATGGCAAAGKGRERARGAIMGTMHIEKKTTHGYLYLKRERTHPGSLGHFSHLIAISSAVYRPILTKSVTEVVAGPVQHLAKLEFRNSKRLLWKLGKGDTPRQPRTFGGHTQAASDTEDTPRQPWTLSPF